MARQITWTPQAREEYSVLITYLLDMFSDGVAERFTDRLANVLKSLETMPHIGRPHPRFTAIRQVIIRPYTVLCYVKLTDQIVIVNLLDSRTSPS